MIGLGLSRKESSNCQLAMQSNKSLYDLESSSPEEILNIVNENLYLFVQKNFFQSPPAGVDERDLHIAELTIDGERIHPLCIERQSLLLVKSALLDNVYNLPISVERSVLTIKYVRVHQQLLDEKSVILHDLAKEHIVNIQDNADKLEKNRYVEILLTIGLVHRMYFEYNMAKACFEKAEAECGLTTQLTGGLGKRTYFQQFDVAQLVLQVVKSLQVEADPSLYRSDCKLPVNLKLNDDTRMEKRQLVDQTLTEIPTLTGLEQAVLLGLYARLEHLHAEDEILHEELLAVLDVVLELPQNFCVQFSALMLRSNVERHRSRTVERAMMQLEELVNSVKKPSGENRSVLFFCTPVPPRWELERQLANLFVQLGSFSSALEIYLRLEMWEDVVGCYRQLELRHKGEEIVRQELAKGETPHLWCLLGECTDDEACFEKAWELSNHKSARAQRDWGMLLYQRKRYEEAVIHFKLSLQVNTLQAPIWLRLAYVTLELEQWEESAAAYRHYCLIDSDNFEAWNNLAKCYVKLGQKSRAWKALQESTKLNYENWKVWDNFMAVSTDCGAFDEVIRAYNRLLDLRDKHIDTDVLKILVRAIEENLPDNDGNQSGKYRDQALKLFGRLTSKVPSNAQIWLLYSQLALAQVEKNRENLEKSAQFLQKADRCATQQTAWEKDATACMEVLEISVRLGQIYLDFADIAEDKTKALQALGKARISLKSTDSKLDQYKKSLMSPLPDNIEKAHSSLKETLTCLIVKTNSLQ